MNELLTLRFKKSRKEMEPPGDVFAHDEFGQVCLVAKESKYYPKPGDVCKCRVVKQLISCKIVIPIEVFIRVPVTKKERFLKCGHVKKKTEEKFRFVPVEKIDEYEETVEKERDKYCPSCFRAIRKKYEEILNKLLKELELVLRARAKEVSERPRNCYKVKIRPSIFTLPKLIEKLKNMMFYRHENSFDIIYLTEQQLKEIRGC